MLKNMKLGTMAIGGFAIVLILTAIVAYIGYSGLSGVADRAYKKDNINRMVQLIVEVRRQEKNFIIRGDKKYVERVKNHVAELKNQVKETRAKFKNLVNKQRMDEMVAVLGKYETAFANFVALKDEQQATDGKMAEAAKEMIGAGNAMRRSGQSNQASSVITYTLDTIRQQKNYMIRGDNKYVNLVHKSVERLVKQAKHVKSRFEQAENKALGDKVIAAAQSYKTNFDKFVALDKKGREAEAEMIAAGNGAVKLGDDGLAYQKANMEAQISTANKTLFGGAIVAILLGLGFAFWIAKAISGGIGKVGRNVKEVAEDAANGKLDSRADVEAVGVDFKSIPAGLNGVLDAINEPIDGLVAEAGMLAQAAAEGKLDTRGDPEKFKFIGFKKIVEGVNDTLDAVIAPLNVAAEYIDRISKGDIPEKITDEYKGDFNEIKNNLNVCIDALNGL
ncbi:MAG: methyl-accepting chemotaxis protein, partial [Desulfobacterales bacterium]|nr:methyl-accepting chemotaxis protein [Desulfobacterales bacterium]